MMIIIVKKKDGGIAIIHPNQERYSEKIITEKIKVKEEVIVRKKKKFIERTIDKIIKDPYEKCKGLQPWINKDHPAFKGEVHEWFVTDQDIKILKKSCESRKQLFWREENGKTVIDVDHDWTKRLMPDFLVHRKHLQRLKNQYHEEICKDAMDLVKFNEIKNEIDLCEKEIKEKKIGPHNDCLRCLNIALEGLDRRISEGKNDKPEIRRKLMENKDRLESQAKNGGVK